MSAKPRSTRVLLLVVLAFMTPFLTAVYLRFSGWQPGSTRNHGDLLAPPLPMQAVGAQQADGKPWAWENTDYRWTLLAQLPAACDQACEELLTVLPKVRQTLSRHAHRLPQFVLAPAEARGDALPALALTDALPELQAAVTGVEVWLVDPHGYLVLHYPAGFDPNGLRRDLSRLIK